MPDSPSLSTLRHYREVWQRKPSLRRVYEREFFARLIDNCAPGKRVLEIGSGPGLLKEYFPDVIASDVILSAWIDLALDCQRLPFAAESLDNVIGLDVLHHIEAPLAVLHETARVLRRGGRVVLIEPWITPLSWVIYRYLHQDDCDWNAGEASLRILAPRTHIGASDKNGSRDPLKGNVTIPHLLFSLNSDEFERRVPGLRIVSREPFCSATYLLTFGFKPFNLLPLWAFDASIALEERSRRVWRSVAALRSLIVLERK